MADLAQVARAVTAAAQGSSAGLLERLCTACARVLPVEGVAISVMARADRPLARSSSDERVTRLEELQFTLGEGPGVAAFSHSRPVAITDLFCEGMNWPVFAAEAAALVRNAGWQIRSVFAFPLHLRREPLGVLDVYRRDTGELDPEELAQTRIAADAVVMALLGSAVAERGGVDRTWLQRSAADQVVVDQAIGMVMAQLGLGPEEALARLRGHAFAQETMIGEVARAVIARKLRFVREDR